MSEEDHTRDTNGSLPHGARVTSAPIGILERLVKEITVLRTILAAAICLIAATVSAVTLWGEKADAGSVRAVAVRVTELEQHHAADDVRVQNIEKSQAWQQDTMWKLSEKMRVPDVSYPPTPAPIPTIKPIPSPTGAP